jgi:hypothetical protein
MAFVIPGLASIALGLLFARIVPREHAPPAQRVARQSDLPRCELARVVLILTLTSTCGSLVFNFTTNGNGELYRTGCARSRGQP